MECQRTSPQLQWKDVERSASGSDGAGPPAGCYSYSALCGTGGVESSSPMWLHGERSEGGGISRAVIPRRGRKPAMLLVSRQTIGIALFGLTCLGQGSCGSLTGYLGSYLRYFGSGSSTGFQEMLLLSVAQGAVQGPCSPRTPEREEPAKGRSNASCRVAGELPVVAVWTTRM